MRWDRPVSGRAVGAVGGRGVSHPAARPRAGPTSRGGGEGGGAGVARAACATIAVSVQIPALKMSGEVDGTSKCR